MRGKRPKGTPVLLAGWASKHADGDYELRAKVLSEQVVVQRWPGTMRGGGEAWATEVLALAQEDTDVRGSMTEYSLVHVDSDGRPSEYTIRCRAVEDESEQTADVAGLLKAAQRAAEEATRNMHLAYGVALKVMADAARSATQRADHLEELHEKSIARHREAMEALAEAQAADVDIAVTMAREERWDKLIKLAEMGAQKMLAESTTKKVDPPKLKSVKPENK